MSDAGCFHAVRNILSKRQCRQYIVLSAPGKRHEKDEKITDLLVRAHNQSIRGSDFSVSLSMIRNRFIQIIQDLHLRINPEIFLQTLESDIKHSADQSASRGEYLCARLFSLYAGIPFVDASELIHFDENGQILSDQTTQSLRRMARMYPCAVIPGFYGSMPDGTIKTFSRGGSDITGSLIAAALNSDIYENWTDVDGLMSADPSICPDAVCHPAVSYRQMRMLAKSGAKILHPYCVEPVCEAGIPTVLKNTFSPELPGTYISDQVRQRIPCICALHSFSALPIDSLNAESRIIADRVLPDRYLDKEYRRIIAIKSTDDHCIGTPVSVISAFGLSAHLRSEASDRLSAVGELHTEHCSKYLVLPEFACEAQRILHSIVMQNTTESRIP